jgi:hypothetical protein
MHNLKFENSNCIFQRMLAKVSLQIVTIFHKEIETWFKCPFSDEMDKIRTRWTHVKKVNHYLTKDHMRKWHTKRRNDQGKLHRKESQTNIVVKTWTLNTNCLITHNYFSSEITPFPVTRRSQCDDVIVETKTVEMGIDTGEFIDSFKQS